MLEEFKKHKILSKFFSNYKFLDENTKKDIKKFRILDTNTIFEASNLVGKKQIESTDFDTKEILKLFNSSNMSA